MNSKRLYYLLLGAIALLCVALIVGAAEANSLMTKRANRLLALKAQSQALDQEQQGLASAKQEVKKYAPLEQITKSVVPEDKDQAEAVREIVKIAGDNTIALSAVTFPASNLGGTGAGIASGTSGVATPSAAAAANSQGSKLSQLQPVKSIPGVYVLQITVQSDPDRPVPYNSFINFLSALELNRRTAQISSITLQPSQKNPNLISFTLILNEYIKP